MSFLLTGSRRNNTFEGSRTSGEAEFRMEYSILDKEESAEMEMTEGNPLLAALFGSGKGSGAALMMFALGIAGVILCLAAGRKLRRYRYTDEENKE